MVGHIKLMDLIAKICVSHASKKCKNKKNNVAHLNTALEREREGDRLYVCGGYQPRSIKVNLNLINFMDLKKIKKIQLDGLDCQNIGSTRKKKHWTVKNHSAVLNNTFFKHLVCGVLLRVLLLGHTHGIH